MNPVKLQTTDAQLHELQHGVNEARETSESIRVPKAALWALLQDHYAMNGALSKRGEVPEVAA
jgi:hypothetical protein